MIAHYVEKILESYKKKKNGGVTYQQKGYASGRLLERSYAGLCLYIYIKW